MPYYHSARCMEEKTAFAGADWNLLENGKFNPILAEQMIEKLKKRL